MVRTGLTRSYADSMEEVDFSRLQEFAARSGFFQGVSADTYCAGIDALGQRDGVGYAIEIKSRTYVHSAFDTWYMEADKYAELMRRSRGNIRPVFVNFFSDGYTAIWCVDPDKGGIDPGEPVKRRVKNPGTGEVEITSKYELSMKNAVVYDDNFRRRQ